MRRYDVFNLRHSFLLPTAVTAAGLAALGCQESTEYETRKPVIEDSYDEQAVEESAAEAREAVDEAANEADEAIEEAADSVSPDKPVVDVNTPLGNVDVSRDRATGDAKVDVDTPRADVEVGDDE